MILVCKGTCAPVAPLLKGRGGSALVMHHRSGVPEYGFPEKMIKVIRRIIISENLTFISSENQ